MTLFINACVREQSRTKRLTDCLLSTLDGPVTELRLDQIFFPISDGAFLDRRDALISARRWDDELFTLARQFAAADEIVIAAPYWDLSFPAALKQYIEQINVVGITFEYTPQGIPRGLCRAKRLTYVTTSGGDYAPDEYGFGYIKALARGYYGIEETELIKATGLDLVGADAEQILAEAEEQIMRRSKN